MFVLLTRAKKTDVTSRETAGAPRRNHPRHSGFSLVELLVVIAILAILISMLFPSLRRARREAMDIVCMNQLRQLQIGIQIYSQDYSDSLPDCYNWVLSTDPDPWRTEIYWGAGGQKNIRDGVLFPYLGTPTVYLCPVFEEVAHNPPANAESRPGIPYGSSYASVPAFDAGSFEPARSYSLSMFANIARTYSRIMDMPSAVFFADENPWRASECWGWNNYFGINNGHLASSDMPGEYHRSGYAFATMGDGHIQALTPWQIKRNVSNDPNWEDKLNP